MLPSRLFSLEDGSTTANVLDVIRRGGVPYPYGEIEHDVIAALMRTRVQISRDQRTGSIKCSYCVPGHIT